MKIAIIRSIGHVLQEKIYNSQESGLAAALCNTHGVDVDIYTAGNRYEKRIIAANGEHRVRQFRLPFIALPKYQAIMPQLWSLLAQNRYDLIQVQDYNFLVSLQTIRHCRRAGIKSLVYHGPNRGYSKPMSRLIQKVFDLLFLKFIDRTADGILVKTTAAKAYLEHRGFKTNISVCPIGLDVAKFDHRIDIDWAEVAGLPADSVKFLYVGNIQPGKNIHFIIDVFSRVTVSKDNAYFIFVGGEKDPRYTAKVMNLIRDKNLQDRIRILGTFPQANLPSLYEYCDLTLMCSDTAIYGMALMEAMYFGLPAVANNNGGFKDILTGSDSGVLIDGRSANAWARSIDQLLSDQERLQRMGIKASEHIRGNLVWDKVVGRFHKQYMKVVYSV